MTERLNRNTQTHTQQRAEACFPSATGAQQVIPFSTFPVTCVLTLGWHFWCVCPFRQTVNPMWSMSGWW